MLLHQSNGTLTDFRRKFVVLAHGSIFSKVGASSKLGAIAFLPRGLAYAPAVWCIQAPRGSLPGYLRRSLRPGAVRRLGEAGEQAAWRKDVAQLVQPDALTTHPRPSHLFTM